MDTKRFNQTMHLLAESRVRAETAARSTIDPLDMDSRIASIAKAVDLQATAIEAVLRAVCGREDGYDEPTD